jgi:hypothetical protein
MPMDLVEALIRVVAVDVVMEVTSERLDLADNATLERFVGIDCLARNCLVKKLNQRFQLYRWIGK